MATFVAKLIGLARGSPHAAAANNAARLENTIAFVRRYCLEGALDGRSEALQPLSSLLQMPSA